MEYSEFIDAMTDVQKESYTYVEDVIWNLVDRVENDYWLDEKDILELKAKIEIYRTIHKLLEAPYLEGVE